MLLHPVTQRHLEEQSKFREKAARVLLSPHVADSDHAFTLQEMCKTRDHIRLPCEIRTAHDYKRIHGAMAFQNDNACLQKWQDDDIFV